MRLGVVASQGDESRMLLESLGALGGPLGVTLVDPGDPMDMVVAVGGDGTVLEAAHLALQLDIPLLGFNLGRIGFLAEAEPKDLERVVMRLAKGDFRVEPRLTVAARAGEAADIGLNDVVVEKIESQRLVVLGVEVDGEGFLEHRADGVVVSTSTGSTAYAFSAGGPLVDPRVDALLFTPVAPHSLFNRTLVLPPSVVIRIRVVDHRPVRVSVDGREIASLGDGETVEVTRGPRPLKYVRLGDEGFPARVTRKFDLR